MHDKVYILGLDRQANHLDVDSVNTIQTIKHKPFNILHCLIYPTTCHIMLCALESQVVEPKNSPLMFI